MAKKLALGATGCAAALMLLSFLQDSCWTRWAFGLSAMAFPVLLMVIGASGRSGLGPLRWIFGLLWALLSGCLTGMMAFSGAAQPWLAGLPVSAAFLLFGIWLAPLPLVCFGFAWTSERFGVSEADLERVRRLNRRERGETECGERRED